MCESKLYLAHIHYMFPNEKQCENHQNYDHVLRFYFHIQT